MKQHILKKTILIILFIFFICWSVIGVGNASVIGEKWSIVNGNASWSPRYYHTVLSFNESLWVLGGYRGNDIWRSYDGKSWVMVTDHTLWLPKAKHSSVVFNGEMWVIGGTSASAELNNDVWHSNDGISWIMSMEMLRGRPESNMHPLFSIIKCGSLVVSPPIPQAF